MEPLLLLHTLLKSNSREWAGAETFVLAGASYGAFVALDYAVSHNDRLSGLVLRGVWANGKLGAINAIANILTSDRVNPNKARQVRLWSGTLLDDKDFEEAIGEIFPFYTPPEHAALPKPAGQEGESTEFKGTVAYHSATQNFAFGVNMPQFDVRDQLHKIKVSGPSPTSTVMPLTISGTNTARRRPL